MVVPSSVVAVTHQGRGCADADVAVLGISAMTSRAAGATTDVV
jgi:hypothetical protein